MLNNGRNKTATKALSLSREECFTGQRCAAAVSAYDSGGENAGVGNAFANHGEKRDDYFMWDVKYA